MNFCVQTCWFVNTIYFSVIFRCTVRSKPASFVNTVAMKFCTPERSRTSVTCVGSASPRWAACASTSARTQARNPSSATFATSRWPPSRVSRFTSGPTPGRSRTPATWATRASRRLAPWKRTSPITRASKSPPRATVIRPPSRKSWGLSTTSRDSRPPHRHEW